LAGLVALVCETDGAALADAAVAGVVLAAVAGVVLAVVVAGVVDAVAVAGVGDAVAAAGVAVVLAAAELALGDVFALAAGDFLSFRLWVFMSAGVALVAGCSAEVFVSGVVAGAFFRVEGAFFSGFVTAGDSVAVDSFMAGASVFGVAAGAFFRVDGAFFSGFVTAGDSFAVGSFTAGASVFGATAGASVLGARVCAGFTSAGAFFSWVGFFPGDCDSSGVGCWAITAPASASEAIISKLVIFFMVALFWSLTEAIYSKPGVFACPQCFHARNAFA